MKHTHTFKRVLSFIMALAMVLTLLPVTAFAATLTGGTQLYLKPNSNWTKDNARFAAYFCNGSSAATWVSMTDTNGDGVYECAVPEGQSHKNVIFCRMNPNNATNDWSTKWNQTGDLTWDGTKNLCTINANQWDCGSNVTWSTYVAPSEPVIHILTVVGESGLCGSNWSTTDATNDMVFNEETNLYEKTFENVSAGDYQFKVAADHKWNQSWGGNGPEGNCVVTVEEDGSTVAVRFDYGTKTITTQVTAPEPTDPEPSDPVEPTVDYYLFGFINGANYGCEENASNLGDYKFVDGSVTATFTATSYVAVKTGDNASWYMTDGWQGDVTSVTLYDTTTLDTTADKLMVPGGVEVTFTLVENSDGSLTLSYRKNGATDPEPSDPVEPTVDYYLFGFINGANYGCEENASNLGDYKFVDGSVTATFTATSYVAVKTGDNASWYMTDGWQGGVTSVTLYDTTTLDTTADKLMVPGGVEVTFTLVENSDGSLTLSYTKNGATDPEPSDPEPSDPVDTPADYYLIGYINGADYGDGADYENMGDYGFANGTVTATFETDSYVCVKSGDNRAWYMTDGWLGAVTSAKLYNTSATILDVADKLIVPGGVEVTFTLTENADGTLTLSYEADNAFAEDKSGIQNGTTLHCWNWSFANITANLETIAEQGFTAIQTSPVQPLKEATEDESAEKWWLYYQPVDFVITDANGNALGTKEEFEAMCEAADALGIQVIVDVVANHLANETGNNLSGKIPEKLQADEFWHDISKNTTDYKNRREVTQMCMSGLPDLNTANEELQAMVIGFLKECIDAGADGFRFDAVKHIETPDDDEAFASDFWPNVIGAVNDYAENIYIYGEFLDDAAGTSIAYYTKYMSVTDNAWGNCLRDDVVAGKTSVLNRGYYKAAPASKLVVWAESHDTYGNKNGTSTAVTEANINKTWALAAARADVMGLYLARPESLTDTLLGEADVTGWANPEVKAVNEFKAAFADEDETVGASSKTAYVVRGDSGAVLVNLGTEDDVTVTLPLADGTYYDQITGWTFTAQDGTVSGKIGSTGIAVLTTEEVEDPEPEMITVYFRNDWMWSGVNAYYWGGSITTGWPGDAMEKVGTALYGTEERDVYSTKIPADSTGLIFNGDGQQTADITEFQDGDAFYIYWDEATNTKPAAKFEYDPNGSTDPEPSDPPAGPTYIIAGNDAALFGSSWDPTNTANLMVLNPETGLYEKTYENVTKGTYLFKVTVGSWSQNWGGTAADGNYELVLDAISHITIRFNETTKEVSVLVTPTGEVQQTVTDVTIHYRNVNQWSLVNGYIWDVATSDAMNGIWPGTALTEDADHPNWYTIKLTEQNAPSGIGFIFNNGSSQTGDIKITENGEYWYDGALLTEAPADTWPDGSVSGDAPTGKTYKATFHFANNQNWEAVNLYTWIGSGTTLTGSWPGNQVTETVDGFLTATVTFESLEQQDLNFIFNNGSEQTVDLKLPASAFTLDAESNTYKAEKWVVLGAKEAAKFTALILDDPASIVESPVIEGNSVTFNFGSSTATSVSVAGSFNSWTPAAMIKGEKAIWTLTVEDLTPGDHQYKFIVDDSWILDPMNGNIITEKNGNQNSAFCILSDESAPDDNTVTIRVHYERPDGNYENWNLWVWGSNMGGHQVDFKEVDGEMIATIILEDARAHQSIGFKERKSLEGNDWAEQADSDRIIDLSTVVSGTIDYYIPDCTIQKTDMVYKNKILSVELDYDNNTVVIKTTAPVADPEAAFSLVNGEETLDTDISADGTTFTMTMPEDFELDLVKLHEYKVKYGTYTFDIGMDTVYASDKFAEEFTYEGDDLGCTYTPAPGVIANVTFRLWAPTAEDVKLNIYNSGTPGENDGHMTLPMLKSENGTWVCKMIGDLEGKYYTYSVTRGGETVEACDPYARTTGVNGQRAMIINLDSTDPTGWNSDVNPNPVTSYTDAVIYELHVRDFSIDDSSGVSQANRGKFLAFTEEGTTTANGVSTGIDYLDDLGITHLHLLPVYDYGSVDETKCDSFNWGYDPVNYNVPEGSYSTDPYDGASRVSEMKQMVKSLHDHDISVVMDVVYNHVYDADAFCFNQIVPGYFSRVNSNFSGCGNDTASEREMVRKYIVESVLYWTEEYHIDGFRFDLVGLIDVQTINEIVEEVHKIRPDVIFYGEGWDMDGTNREPGTEMAKQHNADKTPGFAYFSDSMRNLIAGNNGESLGFVSGATGTEDQMIRDYTGHPSSWGSEWTSNPQQVVQYVSCHDNHTLVDKLIKSTGKNAIDGDIVKMNNLSAAIYMTAQGIPFIHAGEEMLREKINPDGSRNHNSYNSSDEVNHIEWSNLEKELYADTSAYYQGLIHLRKSHAALRLDTAAKVESYVQSHKRGDSLLQFTFDAKAAGDIAESIIVFFNANTSSQTVYLPAGEWNICVDDDNAGTKVLDTVEGSVTVEGISAMVLIKGETCDHEYEGECDALECIHCGDKTAKDHSFQDGECTACGAADPDYVKPTDPTEPDPTEPDPTEPDPTEPDPTEPDPTEPDKDEEEIVRIFGENRFKTAFKVADALKAELGVEKFDSIIIASGADFADALAGSYLATVKSAPILLSYKAEQNLEVVNYIRQNVKQNGTVYILGGSAAVPAALDVLLLGYQVKRLAGDNRFETNLAILKEAGLKDGQDILVCTGTNFADSLSASATGLPILLVYSKSGKLMDVQKEYLATVKNGTFTVIGGEKAVGTSFETELKAYGNVKRLEGANRFQTSVKVAETFFTAPKTAVLAYAKNYPDGLCGGMLAYVHKAPLILTMTGFEAEAKAYLAKAKINTGIVLGGEGLIADDSAIAIFDAAGATVTVK